MSEKQIVEKDQTPKSFIRIDGQELNLVALLELLKAEGIKIIKLVAVDSRKGAEKRVTSTFIPSVYTKIEMEALYDVVRRALENSDEFREHINAILGSV